MHMVWRLEAGLPPPLLNRPLFDRHGRLLGYPDLLDVEAGLVGEYDGADHRGAHRHSKDVGREDLLRRHGLEVFRVTGPDLRVPGRVRARMLEARSRAKWLPEADARVDDHAASRLGPRPDARPAARRAGPQAGLERQWRAQGPIDIPS